MNGPIGASAKSRDTVVSDRSTLLITKAHQTSTGGRELLCSLNRKALTDILQGNLAIVEVCSDSPERRVSSVLGNIDGINDDSLQRVIDFCTQESIRRVFIDGSNLGLAAKAVKSSLPFVEVITFFHNCEARFFLGAARQHPSIKAVGVLLANYLAERAAVRFSDQRICLTERDSRLLKRIYGRRATHISPMVMQDQVSVSAISNPGPDAERYALFVGGSFYANRQGIEWYVDHVATQAPIKTYVVGKGLEQWKEKLERNGNVQVIGAVDHVAPWYLGAQFVIAPIFDGSGMKTKVAEALMFGKRIVGTPEAFVGYEDAEDIGMVCTTPAEFLEALHKEMDGATARVDPRLRGIYEDKYSYAAAKSRLATILSN